MKNITKVIVVIGDEHINSTVGICPPRVTLDDGGEYEPSLAQRWLWDRKLSMLESIKQIKEKHNSEVIIIHNGDLVDVNKYSRFQLIEPENRSIIVKMALSTLEPELDVADSFIFVRGTEVHTGGSGELEEIVASSLPGAVVADPTCTGNMSMQLAEISVDGVNIVVAHHPPHGTFVPWTSGSEAIRTAANLAINYFGHNWVPDYGIFNHKHKNADSFDNFPPSGKRILRVIYNRAFSLKSSYVSRIGLAFAFDTIGALAVLVREDGSSSVIKFKYQPEDRGRINL